MLALLSGPATWAQSVTNYAFSQGSGTYAPISGTVLGTATSSTSVGGSLDNTIYASGTLPFTFYFNGTGYTSCNVSTNGFITFGTTAPSSSSYTPISATTAYAGAISAVGIDLNAVATGDIQVQTVGTAPNREFVIQWSKFRPYALSSTAYVQLNFQIRLKEDNTISIVYGTGPTTGSPATSGSAQVGLRGATNSDYKNRIITANAWASSTPGTANTSSAVLSTTSLPPSGLIFSFAAPQPAAPTTLTFANVTGTGLTLGFTDNSTTETKFLVQQSTDNITFTTPTGGTITSTTTAGTGTAYSLNLTGLTPGTTYYFRVLAVAEVPSSALTGSQATAAGTPRSVSSLTYTQNGATTYRGQVNQQVTGLNVNTAGNSGSALTLNSITFDLGSTSAADITNARLYSTGSSATFATTTLVATTGTIAGSYTLTLTTPAALPTGDNYFWLAYDITATATPGNTVASVPTAIDVAGTSYTAASTPAITRSGPAAARTIAAPLNGTYSVGVGGQYPTLTAAISDLTLRGIDNTTAGATGVTFSLINQAATTVYNTANGETFPLTLGVIAGADATHRLTIKPASGVTASISGSAASSGAIVLNGADYVTIDGSNAPGGTTRDLSITNSNTSASAVAIWVKSLGTGAGATYDQLLNLNLAAGSNSVNSFGIFVGGSSVSTSGTGADNDYLTLQNNAITTCYMGIYVSGTTATSAGGLDGLVVTGNVVGPATAAAATNITGFGMRLAYAVGASVSGNTVRNVATSTDRPLYGLLAAYTPGLTLTNNVVTDITISNTFGTYDAYGLVLSTGVQNATINGNTISGLSTNSTDTDYVPAGYALVVNTGTANANVTLSNNAVSNVTGRWGPIGIFVAGSTAQSGLSFYYNSVNLAGSYTSSSGALSAAFYVASGATGLDVRNNIFANTLTGSNSSTANYAFVSDAPKTAYTVSNYNDYYVSGTQNVVAYFSGGNRTLPQLQDATTGTGQDANSISKLPPFVSATNLHIDNTQPTAPDLNGKATPVSVTTDFDSQARNASTPDIGADEFNLPTQDVGITALVQPGAANCYAGTQPVQVTIRNFGSTATALPIPVAVTITFPDNSTQTLTGTYSGTLAAGATADFAVGTYTVTTSGSYTFAATTAYSADPTASNDAYSQTVTVTVPEAITIVASPVTPVCGGSPVTLTASSGTAYTYSWTSTTGGALATTTGATVTANPTQTATYTVTGVSGSCTITQTVTVTVSPTPAVSVTAPTSVCEGNSFTVAAAATSTSYDISATAAPTAGIPDNSTTGVSSTVTLSGAPAGAVVSNNSVIKVTLNINHTFDSDVDVYLVGPNGAGTLELTTDNGSSGLNYTNTVLSTAATNVIGPPGNNTAPFTGTYRPEGTTATAPTLGSYTLPAAALNGAAVNGTWTLWVFDDVSGDIGTLANWSLQISETNPTTSTLTGPAGATITGPVVSGNTATFTVNNAPTGANAYTLTTTDNVSSCATTTAVNVTVNPGPTATVTSTPPTVDPGQAATVTIALTGTGPWTFTYTTNGANPQTVTNTSTNPYTFSTGALSSPTTYALTALNDASCPATAANLASATVTVGINAPQVDVAAVALLSPASTLNSCVSGPQTVTVRVQNAGTQPLNLSTDPVTVTVNVTGAATQTYTTTLSTGTLAANATQDVTLTTALSMSTSGTYTFALSATTPADGNTGNDTRTETRTVPLAPAVVVTAPTENCAGTSFTVSAAVNTYSGTAAPNAAIPDNSTTGATSTVTLSGAPAGAVISSSSLIRVRLNINHAYLEDVDVYLVGPNGAGTLELTTDNGGSGDNYTNTVLSTAATNVIGSTGNTTAPFTGTYRPESTTATAPAVGSYALPAAALNGAAINGTWTLRVFDDASLLSGTLVNWTLEITDPVSGAVSTLTGPAGATITGPVVSGGTSTFTVSNAPLGANGYTLTTTDNTTNCAVTNNFSVTTTETSTWTGAVSTDWNTAGNWSACVPDQTINALIPGGLARYPVLPTLSGGYDVKSLTIASGATLTHSASNLRVWGDLTNNGTATFSGGTVLFRGGAAQTLTGTLSFNNVTVNKSADTLRVVGNQTIAGSLTMTSGIFKTYSPATTYQLTLAGTISETASSFVLGNVVSSATLGTDGASSDFGGLGLTLTARSTGGASLPGLTTVLRRTGKPMYGMSNSTSIRRQYDIQPAVDTNLNVDMVFGYADSGYELHGLPEAELTLFSNAGVPGGWRQEGFTSRDAAANTVTLNGLNHLSLWTLGSSATPLPVSLTSFEAKRQGADALLTWTTAQEKNNRGFEVQVSTDGRTFRRLGFVASEAPNSTTARRYQFLDREAGKQGLRYYRLRQLDLDGTEAFFGPKAVQFEGGVKLAVSVLPNPFGQQLSVDVTSPAAGATELLLYDALGRVVLRQPVQLGAGAQRVELREVQQLPAGTYLLRLSSAGQTGTVRVVKQ
ncbi:proprotein convertase P-domain-containing protein [Hymenobacter gummosus]|uniref:proprotein convertase P-domain-containing protein n=1 Tax=Hymenobacter gummosus TaxID=1776032 RepID=UPI001404D6FD|nr:proprotein convertase P-domain-containing protein [Hymenobacter gummosus]